MIEHSFQKFLTKYLSNEKMRCNLGKNQLKVFIHINTIEQNKTFWQSSKSIFFLILPDLSSRPASAEAY